MKLGDFIVKDAIIPELKATSRNEAIEELVQALAAAGAIAARDAEAICQAVIDC